MSKSLVIVESPAKARTIAAFLGKGFVVESSIGHIRDLPRRANDVPPAYKKEPWARLGVDVEHDFKPLYVVDADKKTQIQKLKGLLKEADELFLATDEDREGESIAWHLLEVLNPKVPVKRMVFHEITRRAIEEALSHPREVDRRLVDAQEARRILDRLYGYEVSPVLWKKIMPKLSAGRVQSVATRIIVERERERIRFTAAKYWDIEGHFRTEAQENLSASLLELDGKRVATGKDFDENGRLTRPDLVSLDRATAESLAEALAAGSFSVRSVERKPARRSPAPPFMTSTLQQEAGRKLRFSSSRTMKVAQTLYENGYITYMRTDSTTLSDTALRAARSQIETKYGKDYLPDKPRVYAKKVKNAQEAHEAIRPAGDSFRLPEEVAGDLAHDQARLYELIWKRTVASQMRDAELQSVNVRIAGAATDGRKVELSVSGQTIQFPGFLRAYVEGSDDPNAELENRERPLPPLAVDQRLLPQGFEPKGHETQPPARFTEASLVRRLEELGVGRPSTYASIITTILDRGYVWKKGSALVPSFRAFAVIQLLERHFAELVDYAFTARMEDDLDAIAQGQEQAVPWLHRFYFGAGKNGGDPNDGLRSLVAEQLGVIDARAINSLPLGSDAEGREIVVRVGRYGAYLQRGDQNASVPDDLAPDELTLERAAELLEAPSGDRELGPHPETAQPVFVRNGRFGAYVQLGAADGGEKPKTSSLLSTMTPDNVTLADAVELLALPRTVGQVGGEPITVQLGRYGPYVTHGKENRSLENEGQLFTLTLDEAKALLAQPRQRMRRTAREPLREIGQDPVSGKAITLRQGRFGPYVTDGETNASLRRGDVPEQLAPERAFELLAERRERGPAAPKRGSKKRATKKRAAGDAGGAKKTRAKSGGGKKKAGKKRAAAKSGSSARKTGARSAPPKSKTTPAARASSGNGGASAAASPRRSKPPESDVSAHD
ncbi:MAG TPA: type I DNA topoisomerase [Polyangiaceae bacterium]